MNETMTFKNIIFKNINLQADINIDSLAYSLEIYYACNAEFLFKYYFIIQYTIEIFHYFVIILIFLISLTIWIQHLCHRGRKQALYDIIAQYFICL